MQNDLALREIADCLVIRGEHDPLLLLARLAHGFGFDGLALTLVEQAHNCLEALTEGRVAKDQEHVYREQVASLFGIRPQ